MVHTLLYHLHKVANQVTSPATMLLLFCNPPFFVILALRILLRLVYSLFLPLHAKKVTQLEYWK